MERDAEIKLKILVCYYQPWELPKDDLFMPIQAGKAVSGFTLNMRGDDTGDNISDRNATFSEFTAWYWAWKNIKTMYPNIEYIGLSHYRRYFNLEQPDTKDSIYYRTTIPEMKGYGDRFIQHLEHADIILSKPEYYCWALKKQYARCHHEKDYIFMKNIVHEICPEYISSFDRVFEIQGHMSPYCIFVSKYTFFDEYFTWLFKLLFEAEKVIDVSKYTSYQRRALAFLAERLLNVYVYHHNLRVAYRPIYYITTKKERILNKFKLIKYFMPHGIIKMRDNNISNKKR